MRTVSEDVVRTNLHYDPATGIFTWLTPSRMDPQRAGKIAGMKRPCRDAGHYLDIRIAGETIPAHRLAWFYMTGEWPEAQIDHRNRVKHDNRWENLREATVSQNQANRSSGRQNQSGFPGVFWGKRDQLWCARITVQGKTKHLGWFKHPEDAAEAYRAAKVRFFGEFADEPEVAA